VTDAAAGSVPSATPSIGTVRKWVLGARPRTLVAAAVPVFVGTALARWLDQGLLVSFVRTGAGAAAKPSFPTDGIIWWRALAALVVAAFVQIGTNYANDYSDGKRGTDDVRVGPLRLVASRLASPAAVRTAALVSFGVAGVAGLALAAATSWWILLVGAACFAAGWLYTGGPKPYGYLGLGEVFVFAFFGVVATMGTTYVLVGRVTLVSFVASIPVGLLAVALLEANNLRDVAGDAQSGKKTLAVRLGRAPASYLYTGALMGVAIGVGVLSHWRPYALLSLVALPLAVVPIRLVHSNAQGRELLPVLIATARVQLVVGLLLTIGIVL
jgi:1,4-dihydroxy-2-naphthoate octaprenyltransferase